MAYNKVLLAGIVDGEPDFNMDSEHGDILRIKLKINRVDIGKTEIITVSIFHEELLNKALEEIHEGDYMVVTNGRITTTNYLKISPIICPNCQNVEYKKAQGEKTEIEVYNYQVMKNVDASTAIGLNKVFLLGNICAELNFRPGANNGKDYVKYKLAVNRGKSKDGFHDKKTADFPFIVSFNNEATNANKYLKPSSEVFIEGAVQEREIAQRNSYLCPSCKQESQPRAKSIVREIITNKVEYINTKVEDKDIQESK